MAPRLIALALALALLPLPLATSAAASGIETPTQFDAVVVVSEADLQALLESGALDEYSLVTAAEVGLDEAALVGAGQFAEDSLLTPSELGLDNPDTRFFPLFGGFSPFFRGFVTLNGTLTAMFLGSTITTTLTNVRVPFFRFVPFAPVFSRPFFPFAPFGRVLIIRVCC